MDENKKQIDTNRIIILLLAVLLVIGGIKIRTLSDDVKNLKSQNSNLDSEIQMLRNEINSVYNNVDKQLKEEASLISGVDYTIGNPSEDMKSVQLSITVVPKMISDDTELSVAINGNSASLTRNGNEFTGTIDVGLFVDYDQWPLLTIKTSEGTKTEYLDGVDVSYLFSNYLPTLEADMSASSKLSNGKLQVEAGFRIASHLAHKNAPVTFTSFTLIEEMNGKEISKQDITDEVRKSGENYNTRYIKSFEVSPEDELKVYVIAEDSLGYVHKALAHYWIEAENGAQAETVFGGETIFDKNGNMLYGDKSLWE
ncbi:MAG: hypothetical protein E7538_09580 [Ruminococcaceae bacterium]|nr:hypothetical protein [Oscillospiraceae bacterium]